MTHFASLFDAALATRDAKLLTSVADVQLEHADQINMLAVLRKAINELADLEAAQDHTRNRLKQLEQGILTHLNQLETTRRAMP